MLHESALNDSHRHTWEITFRHIWALGFALYGRYISSWCGIYVCAANICHILGTYKGNMCKIFKASYMPKLHDAYM